ncbi:MAG: restriction endonuclease subunit S [Candidatus Competibacteraceae bacterium]|nr:restriction endonuclease subunit S [Candidatus Competibacteraceae bacterium]
MSFPRYERYKDSGIEWLGEVPEHWEISRLGFESWVRARLGWKGLKAEEYVDDGFVFLATPNIKGLNIDFENVNFINEYRYNESPEIQLRVGDVLLAKDGSTLGTVNIVRSLPRPTTVNSSIAVITPNKTLKGVYLYYLFQSSYMENTIQRIKGGMGVPHLFQEDLNKFYIPLPPIENQSIIVAFLDIETAKIDALIAEQQRLIELLKEKRQAVISHTVTKGLNPNASMKDSGIEWLGEVPEHWDVSQSRRMFAVRSEPALATDQMLTASQKYGVLFQSDFVELEGRRVVEVIMGVKSLKHVEPDDFIISMRSFQGGIEWCKLRGSTSFHYVMLRPVKYVYPPFFAHLFKSITYIQALRTTTDLIRDGQELRYSNFTQVDLPIVPIEEQKQIAAYLDEKLEELDTLAKEATFAITFLQDALL